MPQAASKITQSRSPIERLFSQYQIAAAEKARCYALFAETRMKAGVGPAAYAAVDRVEELCDAAYEAVEDVADAILAIEAKSRADIAIKARLLAPWSAPEEIGYYRADDISRFLTELQAFA